MKILLVEDNKVIWNSIQRLLNNRGYTTDWAIDIPAANQYFQDNNYNLLILDLMLPWGDGMDFCEHVRQSSDIPVIITTSKYQLEDKLKWFDTWADDYLVKPFDLEELFARVKKLLERTNQKEDFEFGNVQIFLDQQTVFKDWKNVKLTNKEFLILQLLLNHLWSPVSRTDIIDYIWWWEIFDNDSKLDVYISNIRRKLNKDIIKTVKWFWYKIEKS